MSNDYKYEVMVMSKDIYEKLKEFTGDAEVIDITTAESVVEFILSDYPLPPNEDLYYEDEYMYNDLYQEYTELKENFDIPGEDVFKEEYIQDINEDIEIADYEQDIVEAIFGETNIFEVDEEVLLSREVPGKGSLVVGVSMSARRSLTEAVLNAHKEVQIKHPVLEYRLLQVMENNSGVPNSIEVITSYKTKKDFGRFCCGLIIDRDITIFKPEPYIFLAYQYGYRKLMDIVLPLVTCAYNAKLELESYEFVYFMENGIEMAEHSVAGNLYIDMVTEYEKKYGKIETEEYVYGQESEFAIELGNRLRKTAEGFDCTYEDIGYSHSYSYQSDLFNHNRSLEAVDGRFMNHTLHGWKNYFEIKYVSEAFNVWEPASL